jgi:hypothetical protein
MRGTFIKFLSVSAFLLLSAVNGFSQNKYFTRTGHIQFLSETPLEKIEANHHQCTGLLNTENGNVAIVVNIKGFEFEKALMEEHFNENYMESDKYPKATFEGKIETDFSKLEFFKPYTATVKGKLTMHGVTRDVVAKIKIVQDKNLDLKSLAEFEIVLKDYNISIPKMVEGKIAENVKIKVEMNFQQKK